MLPVPVNSARSEAEAVVVLSVRVPLSELKVMPDAPAKSTLPSKESTEAAPPSETTVTQIFELSGRLSLRIACRSILTVAAEGPKFSNPADPSTFPTISNCID